MREREKKRGRSEKEVEEFKAKSSLMSDELIIETWLKLVDSHVDDSKVDHFSRRILDHRGSPDKSKHERNQFFSTMIFFCVINNSNRDVRWTCCDSNQ